MHGRGMCMTVETAAAVDGTYPAGIHSCLSIFMSKTMQGLFVPFARIGSSDPVRVLRLFHNKYTGYN